MCTYSFWHCLHTHTHTRTHVCFPPCFISALHANVNECSISHLLDIWCSIDFRLLLLFFSSLENDANFLQLKVRFRSGTLHIGMFSSFFMPFMWKHTAVSRVYPFKCSLVFLSLFFFVVFSLFWAALAMHICFDSQHHTRSKVNAFYRLLFL